MYLLYLDESGLHDSKYFVLGDIAIFERQIYWLASEMDKVQTRYLPNYFEPINLHVSDIRAAEKEPWKSLEKENCYKLIADIYNVIVASDAILFAIAAEKAFLQHRRENSYDRCFEELMVRFDRFLVRKFKEETERHRGLVILAESSYQLHLEEIAQRFRASGTRRGELYNLAEIPLFTQAQNSRLLQAADFCANAVFGRYESGYARYFDKIVQKFDEAEGKIHGLFHLTDEFQTCSCPACLTRKLAP